MYKRGLKTIVLGAALVGPFGQDYSFSNLNYPSLGCTYNSNKGDMNRIEIVGYEWDITSLMSAFKKIKKYNRQDIGKFYEDLLELIEYCFSLF